MSVLSDDERRLLEWFAAPEQAEYEVYVWAIPNDVGGWEVRRYLDVLKRNGLLDADGRAGSRKFWITEKGKAVAAP